MKPYKCTLYYDGTDYFGWQEQNNASQPSVQEAIENVVSKINGLETKIIGASRTDRGVHSTGQVAKISFLENIPQQNLLKAVNDLLPKAIRLFDIEECDDNFHPIAHAKSKTYHYYFSDTPLTPFENRYCTYMRNFNIELMTEGARLFIGTYDFQNFYTLGSDVSTTVREIYQSEISQDGEKYFLEISGSGFLKQMIRLIMGALFQLGHGQVTLDDLKNALHHRQERKLGPVAPPEGLFLMNIQY